MNLPLPAGSSLCQKRKEKTLLFECQNTSISFILPFSRAQLRRSHVHLGRLPIHFQLVELRRQVSEDVGHGARLPQHAVLERSHHVPDGEGGDASLQELVSNYFCWGGGK